MKRAMVSYLLCIAFLSGLTAATARAQQARALMIKGNRALLRDDPEGALKAYDALAEAGIADGNLEYNRALAHAEAGQLPRAMLHLERALRLAPGDDGAEAALERVRDEIGRRLAQRHGEATVQTRPPLLEAITAPLSAEAFAWVLWVATLLGSAAWISLLLVKREALRLGAGVIAAVAVLLACVGAAGLAVKTGLLSEGKRALVVLDTLPVREGPDEKAPRVDELDGGSRVQLLDTQGAFSLLQTGKVRGWVRAEGIATY